MKAPLLVGVVAVAVAGPIGYNVTRRHQEQVRLIQTKIAQEHATQQAQADVAAMLRQVERYQRRLPQEATLSQLVAEAVSLGEQAGLELTTIRQESPQAFTNFTRLAATFEFAASYHQLGTFLDLVERSPRFMRVETLQVTSASRADGGTLQARVTLSTVYLPPALKGGP
jgi:Tfp pilus assembly protein PilO